MGSSEDMSLCGGGSVKYCSPVQSSPVQSSPVQCSAVQSSTKTYAVQCRNTEQNTFVKKLKVEHIARKLNNEHCRTGSFNLVH